MGLVLCCGTRVAVAAYADEVLADDPIAYFRLDESGFDAKSLGSAVDALGEYHADTVQEVPGLIRSDPNTAALFLGDIGDDTTGVHIPDFAGLNTGGPWEEKSVVLWFQANDANTPDEQVLFEEGGSSRGINLYVREGEVIVGAWNRANDGPGSPWKSGPDNPPGGNIYLGTPISSGEIYQVALVMDGDNIGTDGTLTGYLNGQPFAETTGVGLLYDHGDNTGIGHVHQNTYFRDGNWIRGNGMYFEGVIDELSLYNTALSADRIAALYAAGGGAGRARLEAGDADQDLDFDQIDLVQVQIAAKYLTGQAATWGEGDWDAAPGGGPDNPPAGNGFFDQLDIVSALGPGNYLNGPYAAIGAGGTIGDGQTSIVYNANTGEVEVDAPAGTDLTSVNIDSAAGIFTGDAAQNLGGSFDNDSDNNIFIATFGSSFGSLSFGNVAQTGLTEEFVASDLTVVGSLAGGGDLGAVDLIYVPEPSTLGTLVFGMLLGLAACRIRPRLLKCGFQERLQRPLCVAAYRLHTPPLRLGQ